MEMLSYRNDTYTHSKLHHKSYATSHYINQLMHYSSTKLNMQFHENIFHPNPSFRMRYFLFTFHSFFGLLITHYELFPMHSYLIK